MKKLNILNISENVLSRDEMKTIMAGSDGDSNSGSGTDWYRCKCYTICPGEYLGTVRCTSETGQLQCCQAHYGSTGCTECSNI